MLGMDIQSLVQYKKIKRLERANKKFRAFHSNFVCFVRIRSLENVQTNRFQENLFGHTFSKLYVNKHGLWMPDEGLNQTNLKCLGQKWNTNQL